MLMLSSFVVQAASGKRQIVSKVTVGPYNAHVHVASIPLGLRHTNLGTCEYTCRMCKLLAKKICPAL